MNPYEVINDEWTEWEYVYYSGQVSWFIENSNDVGLREYIIGVIDNFYGESHLRRLRDVLVELPNESFVKLFDNVMLLK
jgi:hypothetical protein